MRLGLALAFLALSSGPADARTLTIRQPRAPQLTLTVPAGWRAHVARRRVTFRHGRSPVHLAQCPLRRTERDMSGRHAAWLRHRLAPGIYGKRNDLSAAAAGGSCVLMSGRGALALARRLHPRLGPAGAPPRSNAQGERLARAARARTLALPRARGEAVVVPRGAPRGRLESDWEYDLPARYSHQFQDGELGGDAVEEEVVHDRTGDFRREEDDACWGPVEDDGLEPRLELEDWDAPPARATSWRVAYAAPVPRPDGSAVVRWTGFVAGGEAVIGPDGLLRSVLIHDHGQAVGRTGWRTVQVTFTAFPPAIAPVRVQVVCP